RELSLADIVPWHQNLLKAGFLLIAGNENIPSGS
ncbi:MAG: hypothetical protein ACI831_001809, partial [Candidatus Azotimanducaceae bacterium]